VPGKQYHYISVYVSSTVHIQTILLTVNPAVVKEMYTGYHARDVPFYAIDMKKAMKVSLGLTRIHPVRIFNSISNVESSYNMQSAQHTALV
jgi:hypothetical protein